MNNKNNMTIKTNTNGEFFFNIMAIAATTIAIVFGGATIVQQMILPVIF